MNQKKKLKKLNNKKKRLKEGFVNELFTIEEFKEETEKLDNLIKDLEEKISLSSHIISRVLFLLCLAIFPQFFTY